MATHEQIEKKIRESYWTADAIRELSRKTRGCYTSPGTSTPEAFIEANFRDILNHAKKNNALDELGLQLGIKTDAEQTRIAEERRHRQMFWFTIVGIIVAILLAVIGWLYFTNPSTTTQAAP